MKFLGANNIDTKKPLVSTVSNGIAPLSVSSKTMVANLNSELISGKQFSVSSTAPATPSVNDLWVNTSSSPAIFYYWAGSEWIQCGETLGGSDVSYKLSSNKFSKTLSVAADKVDIELTGVYPQNQIVQVYIGGAFQQEGSDYNIVAGTSYAYAIQPVTGQWPADTSIDIVVIKSVNAVEQIADGAAIIDSTIPKTALTLALQNEINLKADKNGTLQTGLNTEMISGKKLTLGTVAPSTPNTNDIWVDTTTTPGLMKYWNGSAWAAVGSNLTGAATLTGVETLTNKTITSPTMNGTPIAPTAAADTNTTQVATTAYVIGQAGASAGTALAGTAAVGSSLKYARVDHVHPTTGLMLTGHVANGITALGGTSQALGTVSNGSGTAIALANHVHPTTGLMLTTHAANSITGFGANGSATTVARSDHGHNIIAQNDTRAVDIAPFSYQGLSIHLKSNSTDGLNDGGTYHGILSLSHWTDISGGNAHQLAFTDNDNMNIRGYNGTVWSAWKRFLTANDLASTALTGTPTAPTATPGTNTTQIATTAFTQAAIAALLNSAPAALDTLNELSVALGNDPNFATTMTNALALKATIASPTFTGTPAGPTATADTNTTQLATTAFMIGQAASVAPSNLAAAAAIGSSLRYARQDHVHATTGLMLTSQAANGITALGGASSALAAAASNGSGTAVALANHVHPNTGLVTTAYLSALTCSDANAADIAGIAVHYLTTGATNKPTGTDHSLLTLSYDVNYANQMAADWRTNDWYVRNQNNTAWGAWAKLWHSGNLTNLNQLTNGPGYITSSGTSAACSGNAATATVASSCSGNSATATNATNATTAASCSGNAATATTAASCSGNAATATTAASCTGNSATATLATKSNAVVNSDGPRNSSDRLPNSLAQTVRYDFMTGSVLGGTIGNYVGVMTYNVWDGTSGSTGDNSYQLAFGSTVANAGTPRMAIRSGINTTWNAWYEIWNSSNLTLGGTAQPLAAAASNGSGVAVALANHVHATTGLMLTSHVANGITALGGASAALAAAASNGSGTAVALSNHVHPTTGLFVAADATTTATANKLVMRDGNGYIYGTYVNCSRGDEATAAASYVYDSGDGWLRKKSLANAKAELTAGLATAQAAGSATAGAVAYSGNTATGGQFNGSATAPTVTTRLNYEGYLYATKIYNAVYNDYAEFFKKDDTQLEAGDVIIKNPDGEGYIKSQEAYDPLVVGVYSDTFGQCLGGEGKDNDEESFAPVGLAGRVFVKVTGDVRAGQLLTASDIPGVAMAAFEHRPGTVIGKALKSHKGDTVDRIEMIIMLA